MISNLKLIILKNPDVNYIINNINSEDRVRLENWYEKATHTTENIDKIINVFIWCCLDGEYAADTQNPQIFNSTFSEQAKVFEITKEELSSLYFSHSTLFEINNLSNNNRGKKPLFIAFEGLDGSGKSTQINMLAEKLKLMGRKVHLTAEPTNSATGGLLRDTLSNNYKREPSELASLFLADRISHNVNPVWGIQKILNDGVDVITDRYYYSSFAYQGMSTDLDWIMAMNINCPNIVKPDLCIFLDVDPSKCKQRVDRERAHLEIFENDESVMTKTREKFLEVFEKLNPSENIKIIDSNRPMSIIADEIFQLVIST